MTDLRTDANPEGEPEPDEVIEAPSEEEAADDELDEAEADADAPTLAE
jgi:hypothetical protein